MMKKLLVLFPIILLMISCQKEGELTKSTANPITVISNNGILKYRGTFEPTSGITVSGQARVYLQDGQYMVQLYDFSISGGPDLKVYLSKSATPDEFVNLGNLTSQTVYPIPSSVNVAEYSHVLIHCQQYNHLYAIAELIPN